MTGHGSLTPRTTEGKIITMLYALFGVPLMLMCLSSLGGFLAEALQCAYLKMCRPQRHCNGNNTDDGSCVDNIDVDGFDEHKIKNRMRSDNNEVIFFLIFQFDPISVFSFSSLSYRHHVFL